MQALSFSNKPDKAPWDPSIKLNIPMPDNCPHCDFKVEGVRKSGSVTKCEDYNLWTQTFQCPHCDKLFTTIHKFKHKEPSGEFIFIYPQLDRSFSNESIEKISPRFIDLYNQSLWAEKSNHIDLAAMGIRSALEVLIKDFAIHILDKSEEEVASKWLNKSIEDYLDDPRLVSAADVINLLSNDYVHYWKTFPQYDYDVLKKYMELFIHKIEMELMLKNPPISKNRQE